MASSAYRFPCYDGYAKVPEHKIPESLIYPDPRNNTLNGLKDSRFEAHLDLKLRMPVILLVNLDIGAGLVNGSQGYITDFELHNRHIDARIRRSISRKENLRKRQLKDSAMDEYMEGLQEKLWPVVEFPSGRRLILPRCEIWEVGDEKPFHFLGRAQLPIVAGWAMTIHKSQGMTLDELEVDLSRSFERGMLYTAVSRARTMEGLRVRSLERYQLGASPEVRKLYAQKFGIY